MPSTAANGLPRGPNSVRRFRMERSGVAAMNSAFQLRQARIENVAQAITEQVQSKNGESDHEPRKNTDPGSIDDIVPPLRDDISPGRRRRRGAHPEKRSDGRRVGKAGVNTCRSRWTPSR